jgi:hypothetical protein
MNLFNRMLVESHILPLNEKASLGKISQDIELQLPGRRVSADGTPTFLLKYREKEDNYSFLVELSLSDFSIISWKYGGELYAKIPDNIFNILENWFAMERYPNLTNWQVLVIVWNSLNPNMTFEFNSNPPEKPNNS